MRNNRFTRQLPKLSALKDALKQPTRKLLITLGIKAVYAILIAVFFSLFLVSSLAFLVSKEEFNQLLYTTFGLILSLIYLFCFLLISLNALIDYIGNFIDSLVQVFGSEKTNQFMKKELTFSLTLTQKRFISNFLKWVSAGVLAIGTMSAVLLLQQSRLGFTTDANFAILFALTYFLGFCLILLRNLLLTSSDWVLVNLEDFTKTKKADSLKKALISYNKWLGSSLSLRKLFSIAQHVTQAYKIGNESQLNELDSQINKINKSVSTKKICDIDLDLIGLVEIAKEITKTHKSILGFSFRYPLRLMLWEQTKISLSKNYPKLMYLFLGIIFLVILKQFNLLPPISIT